MSDQLQKELEAFQQLMGPMYHGMAVESARSGVVGQATAVREYLQAAKIAFELCEALSDMSKKVSDEKFNSLRQHMTDEARRVYGLANHCVTNAEKLLAQPLPEKKNPDV